MSDQLDEINTILENALNAMKSANRNISTLFPKLEKAVSRHEGTGISGKTFKLFDKLKTFLGKSKTRRQMAKNHLMDLSQNLGITSKKTQQLVNELVLLSEQLEEPTYRDHGKTH